jgi:hypothetical protein
MLFMHATTRFLLLAMAAMLCGCAAAPKSVGSRFSHGAIADEPFSYAIHALDAERERSMEFLALQAALSQALDKRGNRALVDRPRLIFLLGYASEVGIAAPYENFIVLLGFDATNSRPVYQARVKVETKTGRVERVGALVLDALVADLSRVGSSTEPLTLKLGDL